MDPGESWELFDLDTELHVSISEDAKDYLRQFGLEEYNFENYQPSDDPGSYFKDVPREQNPEALFDDLTRESIRRSSGRSSSWSSKPTLANGRTPSSKVGHERRSASAVSRQALPQPPKPPDGPAKQRPPPRQDSLPKNDQETPRTPPKRVSFTEEIEVENSKQKENVDLHQKQSKTMTSFFGRPKVKGNNKKTNQKQEGHAIVANPASTVLDNDTQQQHPKPQQQGKGKNNLETSNQKKGKKFKFPAFDMMRHKKSAISSSQISDQKKIDPTDISSPNPSTSSDSTVSKPTLRPSIQTLDLLSHSPELPDSSLSLKPNTLDFESDMDTIERIHFKDQVKAKLEGPDPAAPGASGSRGPQVGNIRGKGINGDIVEMVSFEQEVNTGVQHEGEDGLDGILVGEHLPPALIAALKGDLNLLEESTRQLSPELLVKLQDDRGSSLLHASAAAGQIACMEYICQQCPLLGTAENKAHLSPAAMAIKHGRIEALDWLLENLNLRHELFPSTARRRCLLHHAAKFGQDGCLRLLLSKLESLPSDFVFSDQHGNTPAHMAAKYGHILCLQTLVEYGLDVCSPNQYDHTPCYYADFNNHRHCAGYLMVVETCAQLARHHVSQSKHIDWLANRNDAICSFTTEALRLSSGIARQSAEDVDVTYHLQQTLDDAMDLVGDVTTQLKHAYEQNSPAQEKNNNFVTANGKVGLNACLERVLELQHRVEGFDGVVNHQTARQQILRVKEVQRRWEKLSQSELLQEEVEGEQEPLVQQLLRERFSDAVQRLLVYRTTQDSAKNLISSHHQSPPSSYHHPPPHTLPLPPHLPTTSSPKRSASPPPTNKNRLTHMDQISVRLEPTNNPLRTNKEEDVLLRLSPRARGTEKNKKSSSNGFIPSDTDPGKRQFNVGNKCGDFDIMTKVLPQSGSVGNPEEIPFDRSSTSSSTSGSNLNISTDRMRQNLETKNNVVESFLKDRIFYQQDLDNHSSGKKAQSSGMFFGGNVPSAPSSSASSDSPRLKFSEFSAFNRVSNRGQGEITGDQLSVDSQEQESLGSNALGTKVTNKYKPEVGRVQGSEPKIECSSNSDTTATNSEPALTIANLTRHNENENISHVKKIISHLEKRKELPKAATELRDLPEPGLNQEVHPVLDPETSSSEDTYSFKKKVKNYQGENQGTAAAGTGESETGSEDQTTSEELSDIDLGPELQGDDLMLGPHGFLDDELEEGEGYGDGIFSPEELLALAPGGRLPLSMQFETSLSTIEEVSVVSESTRTGTETDNDNTAPGSVDLDGSVDSEGTVTSEKDEQKSVQTGHKQPKSSSSANVSPGNQAEFPSNERPWYEMSDEEEGGPSTQLQIPRHRLKEHFTIF